MNDSYSFIEKSGAAPDAPVLFLFHGTGGDEHQFFALGSQLAPGARLVAVRGDVSENGALRYFRRLAEGRYDMADLARATAKLAAFVAGQRGEATEVFALGYSNGANIIAATQFEAPALFDRVALLHPLIPFDPICPAPASEALAGWYRAQGARVSQAWHEGGHELRQEELLAARDLFSA